MSENQEVLLQLAKDVLGEPTSNNTTPEAAGADAHRALWRTVSELGWPLVAIPEASGGAGGGIADLVSLVRGLGRSGAALPLRHSAVGAWVQERTGTHPDGRLTTMSVLDSVGDGSELRLTQTSDGTCTLSGEAELEWGEQAELVILLIEDTPGRTVFVDPHADGVTRSPSSNDVADEPRALLTLDRVQVRISDAGPRAEEVRGREALLDAAGILGAAEAAYELTRRYVGEREQFGRPLRSVPAVKTTLARTNVAVELMETAVSRALALAEAMDDTIDDTAAMAAHAVAAETATDIAATAHQLHGAMGTTLEHPLHLLTRRLWSWRDRNGSHHRELLRLGTEATDAGEDTLWNVLTSNDLDINPV